MLVDTISKFLLGNDVVKRSFFVNVAVVGFEEG